MRRQQNTRAAAFIAAAAAAAMTAGMTAGPSAAQDRVQQGSVRAAAPAAGRQITLITGDRVLLDSRGTVGRLLPAAGRESVTVQVREANGHTYVLPSDAAALVAGGKLDLRLFDVTELSRPEYRQLAGDGVPVIITYAGERPSARQKLTAETGTKVRAELDTVNGEALTVPQQGAAAVWQSLVASAGPANRLASGVKTVSLDGVVKATLDVSVPQIGAPSAWQAGYDGKGVKVAVLDTGMDLRHQDIASKVVAEKNFTDSPDTMDRVGHGTHVASTVAGSGAESQGKYRGVAPGAELINAKVLGDGGAGLDSGIIEGMEWAVAQGAKVVNMSLGDPDTEGVDPMEETINRLSDKALFVAAAGNAGPGRSSLSTPGSADKALTVGAVDRDDVLADFSARGPRLGDGAVKPDVTAPGVSITAADAEGSLLSTDPGAVHPAPGYLSLSGTSQATPHVAGAAALLAQQHPDWGGQRIKAALMGSAKPGPYTGYEQGTGRIDVTAAIKQSVFAESGPLNFGTQEWPHTDDKAITKTITYTNTGAAPVTLDLSATGTDPGGAAVPQGFLELAAPQVTVAAGGTASVDVSVDTRLSGTAYGTYTVAVTAKAGDGQSIRTVGALNYEAEMYDISLKATARDGHAPAEGAWIAFIYGLDNNASGYVSGADGSATVRLPKGDYTVLGNIPLVDAKGEMYIGDDWVTRPKLKLTKDTTMAIDARRTKKIDISVPDKAAEQVSGYVTVAPVEDGHVSAVSTYMAALPEGFRTQQVGERLPAGELTSTITSVWASPSAEYHITDTLKGAYYNGYVQHAKRSDLAELTLRQGASVKGVRGLLWTWSGGVNLPYASHTDLPSTRTVYVQGGYTWQFGFSQDGALPGDAFYDVAAQKYRAGREYTHTVNVGVFGPKLGEGLGLLRDGNTLSGRVQPFADGAGHNGDAVSDPGLASTTLYRNGRKFASSDNPLDYVSFDLPADRATYRLVTTVGRDATMGSAVTTRVTSEYTFTSAYSAKAVQVPASAVRYTPELALDSTARAGANQSVPFTVQGSAAGKNLKSLSLYVSYDHGAKWSRVAAGKDRFTVRNPKAGGSVSFKANTEDRNGSTLSQTIIDAYRTR